MLHDTCGRMRLLHILGCGWYVVVPNIVMFFSTSMDSSCLLECEYVGRHKSKQQHRQKCEGG